MKSETLTLVLVNMAAIMERADESVFPAVYKEVGEALHTDPTGLGSLTLFRSIVQCSCYPLAAYLAIRHNRAHVIALGAFLWAFATFLVAFSSTFLQVAVSRGLNGIGLAIVVPAIQSLVADSTEDHNRGVAFGWLQLTGNVGSILRGVLGVLLASKTLMGIAGWRMAFHLVGVISVIVGLLVRFLANDPSHQKAKDSAKNAQTSLASEMREVIKEAKSVVKIPSFQILVAQGVSGSFPWSALSFASMWLELIGFSHAKTASIWTCFVVACSIGALFGGVMGDYLATRFPNSGRIILSQISSGSTIPLAALLLLGLPYDPSTALTHGLVFFIMGLSISWNGPATNNPIFAEIVPEKSRTSIYALDRSFETILASFAPVVVGVLAENVYGYKPTPKGSSNEANIERDRDNAASLAKALYAAIGLPMAICCFIYSFLYCTYPRDRERAQMVALVESQMQQLHQDHEDHDNESFALGEIEAKGLKNRSEIHMDYGEEVEIEYDDNDDKYLLSHQSTPSNLT